MPGKYPSEDLDLIISHTGDIWRKYAGARFFITGGTGFVGSWIIQAIQHANDTLGCGIEILALSRSPDKARARMPLVYSRPDMTFMAGDICDFAGY
jgi:dTDP-glucose 4,6-dehydratase